ncbi:MAG TPA: hypothetical protein VFX03_13030, partial [Thermomicrobiales bacterium]|nr:hypothetical protein [Thermomicrobiales bacterium]
MRRGARRGRFIGQAKVGVLIVGHEQTESARAVEIARDYPQTIPAQAIAVQAIAAGGIHARGLGPFRESAISQVQIKAIGLRLENGRRTSAGLSVLGADSFVDVGA